ncbi:TPA: prohibitin family protein [Enterobacter bugandensis]|nr:prohibitin family protein [Enterobacter bugandensis]
MKAGVILGVFVAVVLLILSAVFGSWYIIDQGERGVIVRNGSVVGTADPGLHFKMPFMDSVERISVQSKTRVYAKAHGNSRDQQYAAISYSVTYTIPPAKVGEVYSEYRNEENLLSRVVDRQAPATLQSAFGKFTAAETVTKRDDLAAAVLEGMTRNVKGIVTIESVQIENVQFSEAYNEKIEESMKAEIDIRTRRQNLEKEQIDAQIAVTRANGEADSQLAIANAKAKAVVLAGEAEAKAIKAKSDALAASPNLIEYQKAITWNGQLPNTMIPGGATPMINVNTTK